MSEEVVSEVQLVRGLCPVCKEVLTSGKTIYIVDLASDHTGYVRCADCLPENVRLQVLMIVAAMSQPHQNCEMPTI